MNVEYFCILPVLYPIYKKFIKIINCKKKVYVLSVLGLESGDIYGIRINLVL